MYPHAKQSELLRFARAEAGATVIDVYPGGGGDWTGLFSDIVGPKGRVYDFVPAEVAHLNNDPIGRARTEQPGRENVQVVSTDLVALPESVPQADVVWLHLFHHDLHTALLQAKGATPAEFNRAVHGRLKRGGFYVIVDHAAASGTGTSSAGTLHRSSRRPFAKRWKRQALRWTPKARCWRTTTIHIPARYSTRRSRAKPIASLTGS